ncbi:MAG TPA: Uma2 family endonuclease [Thermoanaerobaculia bacterium]|nr:Uma2 family endonuclease [Thermoanaerobaculia bacterium]
MAVHASKKLISVDEYHRMAEAGIVSENIRVELIEGEIAEMAAIGNRHATCVRKLIRQLEGLGSQALLDVQDPVRLGHWSEPQPDAVLLRYREDFYTGQPPTPQDVLLLVEVADIFLSFDRGTKVPLYARSGVREVWIINLDADEIEVYRQPSETGYGEVRRFRKGDTLSPEALPDLVLEVSSLLP